LDSAVVPHRGAETAEIIHFFTNIPIHGTLSIVARAKPPPTTGQTAAPIKSKARRCVYGFLAILALTLVTLKVVEWSRPPKTNERSQREPVPLVAISDSPYLNTRPGVEYVGTEVCRKCHASHDISFRRTGMGRSMAELDLSREPADGEFDHSVSKRRYQIKRSGSQLWHRELLLTQGTDEVLLAEHPLKYVVGSGRHSRTYVVEIDGFLTESPATWYSSKKAWGVSPGYDGADQPGFARPVEENCLYCHTGRVEVQSGTVHKIRVVEAAISCERCHGPGALHVARHRPSPPIPLPGQERGAVDDHIDHTIVNPAHLPRDRSEAVCQQCHLQSDAWALARGRKRTDFRPGLPLQDFKHDYQLGSSNPAMTVVGHVEQLHQSRCYQAAPTLTCATCHDPHGPTRKSESSSLEFAACVKCHQPERCKVDKAVRERESPDNNCVRCHMPRSPTEIPHLAFTHHRIGVHKQSAETGKLLAANETADLTPVLDLKRFDQHVLRSQHKTKQRNRLRRRGLTHSALEYALGALPPPPFPASRFNSR
jgi:Cytochrome c554 and c-prime